MLSMRPEEFPNLRRFFSSMVSIDYMEGSFRQAISCNDFSDYVGLAIGKFHKEHGLKWPMFIKFK